MIEWSGTSHLTLGICERLVHSPAFGPPYSGFRPRALALRGGQIRGKLHVRDVEERFALNSPVETLLTRGRSALGGWFPTERFSEVRNVRDETGARPCWISLERGPEFLRWLCGVSGYQCRDNAFQAA